MDTSQIITQVIIALITIVTTIVVTKLSHSKGSLGITSKLRGMFTPKVRAYMSLFFTLTMCVWSAVVLYRLVAGDSLPTRLEVFFMIFNTISVLGFGSLTVTNLGKLLALLSRERFERDIALIQQVSEAHKKAWQPLSDRAKALTEKIEKLDAEDARRKSEDETR